MNNVPPLPPVPVPVQTQVDEYGFHVPIKKEVRGSVASDFASSPSSKAKSTVADSNSSLAGITRSKSLRYSLKGLPRSDTGEGSMGFGRKLSRALSLKISNSNGSISPAGPVIPIDPAIIEKEKTWLRVLDAGDLKNPQNIKQVKKLCREGIPGSLRGRVWIALTQQKHLRDHELYQSLMEKQKAMDSIEIFDVIERDVARCYPQHVMFIDKDGDGINNLRNILRTYALYNPVLGYTQGMGFIVGMLLMHIPNPEDAFWVLVSMLEGVCKGFYESDLKRVRMDAKVFDMLVKNMDPRLAKYFEANQIDGLMYIPQWFLTIFTSTLPWPSVLRIWDMFLCEGSKALFRMGLAVLQTCKQHLLTKCPTTSEALSYILHIPQDDAKFSPEPLSKAMMRIRLRSRNLEKIRQIVEENGI